MQCAGIGSVEVIASTRTLSVITTGGGFSNSQAMPMYQSDAVAAYLSSGATLPGLENFNPSGRAYPDVSAIGHNLFLWKDRMPLPRIDGTSASAPIFAAILALANNALYANGLPPVGFVNPAIYHIAATTPAAFQDINCAGCVNNCGRVPVGW